MSPPEAEFGVRLIVFGSVDIGWKIFDATIFGFGLSPAVASSAILTASWLVWIGLNGSIVGSG